MNFKVCQSFVPAWELGTATTVRGEVLRSMARGTRRRPPPDGIPPPSLAGGVTLLPALSAPASGTVLLDGAGTERLGVQVVEVELETTRCSKTYRLRLVNCLGFFLHWLAVNAVAETWSEDAVVANQVLCNFVQWMYSHQLPLWRARHTVFGCADCL